MNLIRVSPRSASWHATGCPEKTPSLRKASARLPPARQPCQNQRQSKNFCPSAVEKSRGCLKIGMILRKLQPADCYLQLNQDVVASKKSIFGMELAVIKTSFLLL